MILTPTPKLQGHQGLGVTEDLRDGALSSTKYPSPRQLQL